MNHSCLVNTAKITKNKVSRMRKTTSLTASQLDRKRANDREAKRTMRRQTKEYIKRLERDLEELKIEQSQNETLQELELRNKVLEDELARFKENIDVLTALLSYHAPSAIPLSHDIASLEKLGVLKATPICGQDLSTTSGAVSGSHSPVSTPGDDKLIPNNWEADMTFSLIPSNVSSPWSLSNGYDTGCDPKSMTAPIFISSSMSTPRTIRASQDYVHVNKDTAQVSYYNNNQQAVSIFGGRPDVHVKREQSHTQYEDIESYFS